MSDATNAGSSLKPLLLTTSGLVAGAAIFSAAATQFVAYRVSYHPAIGTPLFAHVYAPWRWIEWQQAAWAQDARRTFQILDVALSGGVTAALVAAWSTARRGGASATARRRAWDGEVPGRAYPVYCFYERPDLR